MANRRDGGTVVLGVDDEKGVLTWSGMNTDHFDSWTSRDTVADRLAEYVDPSISFELMYHEENGRRFIVLTVGEFEDLPVICKRQYTDILRRGACYVRPRRKPESVEVPTQADMRDLLDLALEKRLASLISTVDRAGLGLVPTATVEGADQFDQELGGFL